MNLESINIITSICYYLVFIVAEASGSRAPANRDLAFERMRGHGIEIVSREMVAFEWLQRGGTELFREVNRDFIR